MHSDLPAELLRAVHPRPLVSVAVGSDRYSVGYSPPGSRPRLTLCQAGRRCGTARQVTVRLYVSWQGANPQDHSDFDVPTNVAGRLWCPALGTPRPHSGGVPCLGRFSGVGQGRHSDHLLVETLGNKLRLSVTDQLGCDPLLRRPFQAGGPPVRVQVKGRSWYPCMPAGDRSFPLVLARKWHDARWLRLAFPDTAQSQSRPVASLVS
jgi:hypothetical protein